MGKSQQGYRQDLIAEGNRLLDLIPKETISGMDRVRLWDSINHNGLATFVELTQAVVDIKDLATTLLSIKQEGQMQKDVQQTLDYGISNFDSYVHVKYEIEKVRMRLKRTAEDIVAIGQSLIDIKADIGHGHFIPLLKAEFGMSIDSAQDFMRVTRRFADKNWNFQHLPVSVIYELASPSVSDEIVERTIAGDILPTVDAVREAKVAEREEPVIVDAVDIFSSPVVEPIRVEPVKPGIGTYRPLPEQYNKSAEWYTPEPYVAAARELMGGIDIDPASNAYANAIVNAATFYDIGTNGLNKDWRGRCWLNPPYGKDSGESNQAIWAQRLIEQYKAGVTTEAVLLTNSVTDRKWFQPLWQYPICFTDHRIDFYTVEGVQQSGAAYGSALVYLGPQVERFIDIFEKFGAVVGKIRSWARLATTTECA